MAHPRIGRDDARACRLRIEARGTDQLAAKENEELAHVGAITMHGVENERRNAACRSEWACRNLLAGRPTRQGLAYPRSGNYVSWCSNGVPVLIG